MIASLSIPWGFNKGDEDLGGYHLVWPRDLVETAFGFLAAGAQSDAVRAVSYTHLDVYKRQLANSTKTGITLSARPVQIIHVFIFGDDLPGWGSVNIGVLLFGPAFE